MRSIPSAGYLKNNPPFFVCKWRIIPIFVIRIALEVQCRIVVPEDCLLRYFFFMWLYSSLLSDMLCSTNSPQSYSLTMINAFSSCTSVSKM